MFFDRYDAGEQLATRLLHYKGRDAIVYALPRGGVPVSASITRSLHLPLGVIITRKIGHPLNKEMALCAITEDGELVCSEYGLYGVDESYVEEEAFAQVIEARRRKNAYAPFAARSSKGKIAILVDDGMATGLTMQAAIRSIRKQSPQKIVVAVPVAPHEVIKELQPLTDELIVLCDETTYRGSVGSYYMHFEVVSDENVITLLQEADARLRPSVPRGFEVKTSAH